MKITEIRKKDLDYVAQVLNSPTFSAIDELQSTRQIVQNEIQRRVDEKIQNTKVLPILNKTYAISTNFVGYIFRVIGHTIENDKIIPIIKGFKTNPEQHTASPIDNYTIYFREYYLYYDVQSDKLKFFIKNKDLRLDVVELNENKFKDWCNFAGLYLDSNIFNMKE